MALMPHSISPLEPSSRAASIPPPGRLLPPPGWWCAPVPGLVVIDLDGDGHEQTGWVLVYLHLAAKDRVQSGTWVAAGDYLGHPSCEGGFSTGTHLHIARKFNGEWVPADGALPFNLGGWIAHAGPLAYEGYLTREGETLEACTCSNYKTFITRTESDP